VQEEGLRAAEGARRESGAAAPCQDRRQADAALRQAVGLYRRSEERAVQAGALPVLSGERPDRKSGRSVPVLHRTAARLLLAVALGAGSARAQIPPSKEQIAGYTGLHAAAAKGDVAGIALARATGADPEQRDADGRTPLHVATFLKQYDAVRALLAAG